MAHLGSISISGGQLGVPQLLYTTPVGFDATINTRLLNVGTSSASVQMWMTPDAVQPTDNLNSIDRVTVLDGGIMIENTALAMTEDNSIWIQSDSENISAIVFGHEDALLP